jgi:hypothetical protein
MIHTGAQFFEGIAYDLQASVRLRGCVADTDGSTFVVKRSRSRDGNQVAGMYGPGNTDDWFKG